jgi:predicted type IV restriction endonuclease
MKVQLTLESVNGQAWQSPPIKRLALLLKCMLRAFGFRCVDAREIEPDHNHVTGTCDCDLCRDRREANQ